MKKISGLLLGIFLSSVYSCLWASPSLHGRPGGMRVHSAPQISQGDISLSYSGEYFYQNDDFFNTERTKTSDNIYFGGSPVNSVLLFFGKRSHDIKTISGLSEQSISNSYYESGLLSTIPLSQSVSVGFEASGGSFLADNIKFLRTIDAGLKSIFSWNVFHHFFIHTNFSYRYNQTAKVIRHIVYSKYVSETIIFPKLVYHLITPALGLEYQTKYIDFSAEYTLEYLMRSGLKPFQHPHYVTLGLKWKPSVKIPIQIMVGSDIGLNPADYFIQGWQPTFDYNIFGGVSVGWSSITSENRGMDTTAANKPSVEKNNAAQREAIPTSDVQEAIKPQDFKLEKDPLLLRFRKPDISKNLLLKFRN